MPGSRQQTQGASVENHVQYFCSFQLVVEIGSEIVALDVGSEVARTSACGVAARVPGPERGIVNRTGMEKGSQRVAGRM